MIEMTARLASFRSCRRVTPSQSCGRFQTIQICFPTRFRRTVTSDEKPLPKTDSKSPGPNQEQLPHVSEEAAATSKITGETGPAIDQGTPIQDVGNPVYAMNFRRRNNICLGSRTRFRDEAERTSGPETRVKGCQSQRHSVVLYIEQAFRG